MYTPTHYGRASPTAGPSMTSQPPTGGQATRSAGYGAPPYTTGQGADEPETMRRASAGQSPRQQAEEEAFHASQRRLRVWAGIRHEVVHRLVGMNLRHAMHAWSVRRDRPVAAWAVAFLYAHPTGTVYDGIDLYAVAAGTRLVDHDDDLPGPAHLLYRLAGIANDRHRNEYGWLDPVQLCTYRDPVLATATYIGVAVSCLGNHAQSWETLRRGDSDDIPGHAYALLTDDTALLLTRAGRHDFGRVVTHTTADLTHQRHLTSREWVAHSDVSTMPESDRDVWDQLHHLHVLVGDQNPLPTLQPELDRGRPS